MAYVDQYDLTQDTIFKKKVRVAMFTAAVDVLGEDKGTMDFHEWSRRHQLGKRIFAESDAFLQQFLDAVTTNAAITSSSTDSDIQYQVNQVYNDVAGVGQHQKL